MLPPSGVNKDVSESLFPTNYILLIGINLYEFLDASTRTAESVQSWLMAKRAESIQLKSSPTDS